MTSITKKAALGLILLTSLQPVVLANGLEKRIREITSKTINHSATLILPKPNGTLYVVRGKDLIEHRNPEKENYNIVLKLIEYNDNGTPGYSFADRIIIEAEINYSQPPKRNNYNNNTSENNTFENKNINITIGIGYDKKPAMKACFKGRIISTFETSKTDKDLVETIIEHAIKELNPKLYQK